MEFGMQSLRIPALLCSVFPADWLHLMIVTVVFTTSTSGYSAVPAYSQILLRQHLFHLKKVIVTSAVCGSLAPLKRSFGYPYWADVTACTRLFSLADSCVFGKQSDLPSYCTLRSPSSWTRVQRSLNPKARDHLAEFP
jgi:hypothetical protein